MEQITSQQLYRTLDYFFGFTSFRPLQEEIVTAITNGQDCLAILPTGGGKSLCFQLPGLVLPGITLVISPLISLMTDQVENLSKKGVPAVALNSSLSGRAGSSNSRYPTVAVQIRLSVTRKVRE